MAYEKQTWKTGDVITAEKLNNIESGIKTLSNRGFETATGTNYIYFDDNVELEVQNGVGFINDIEALKGEDGFSNAYFLPSELEVTFDGNTYVAHCIYDSDIFVHFYGATVTYGQDGQVPSFDWSTYPFRLECINNAYGSFEQIWFAANVGASAPHTLRIAGKKDDEVLAVSQTFKEAVKLSSQEIVMVYDDSNNVFVNKATNIPITFDMVNGTNARFYLARSDNYLIPMQRTYLLDDSRGEVESIQFDGISVDDDLSRFMIHHYIMDNDGSVTQPGGTNYYLQLNGSK